MKRCELLSPAGNMEMLKYAVYYGADAVYLGGTKFGARKFATNFSEDELVEAVRFAHLYGVRVYVTVNTLIYEREVEEFVSYVKFLYSIGVDAVLIQDFGMLKLIRGILPDFEIHASTQMHNNHKDMINLLSSIGIKRAVVDREMSLDEIKSLTSKMEIEVFCHGALCVSYSGQCLFSSMVLDRSGNRGACAGMCRLPYSIFKDGALNKKTKYYLSLKDLCTVNFVDKLIEAGVASLKIEGRMKSPEYVGYMTKIYRNLIDSYYDGNYRVPSSEEMKNVSLLFNRGFTSGYLLNTKDAEMANIESPNHIGIHLGKYECIKNKIKIKLDEELEQGDVIRFKEAAKGMTVNFLYDTSGSLISTGKKGEIVLSMIF